ncbi:hypothetical protein IGI04_012987, partial [Brassica rapa subsp. trilocularis]
HQELLRGFIGTTARIFIQQQKLRTTQIFEEDDKDDVIRNTLFAKTNHNQHQLHEWEDSHDQVRDFIGAPIYDEYDYDSFREPRHNSEVTAKEGDMSSHINLLSPVDSPEINDDITKGTRLDRPIFTSDVESYYAAVTKLTDGPIYDVYDDGVFTESYYYKDTPCSDDDQVQGVNNGCNDQVLVDDAYIGVRKQYMNHGLGKKECHRQFHHEPPDRGRHNTTHTKLLDEISHILKLEHDQEDCLKWIDAKEDSETGKLHSIINANRTTLTKDINLTTSTYICGTSLVASLTFLARPWKYGKRISYDSFRNTYDVAFKGTKSTLVEETMDLVRHNKEIGNLSSPLCLFTSAMFRSGSKLLGKASLQNFVILGADVSYYQFITTTVLACILTIFLWEKGSRRYK